MSITLGLEHEPKLLLPDLKKNRLIAMDDGMYYPHHNLYHITGGSVTDLRHDPQLRIGPSMPIILQMRAPKHATFV